MRVACGTDIIEINRIKEAIEKHGIRFQNEIFTEKEIKYCESHNNQKYQHYAVRFSAKEAIFKAISNKLSRNYSWKDFEIVNNEIGKPEVFLKTVIPEVESIDVSLSHCKEYAIANVVVLFK